MECACKLNIKHFWKDRNNKALKKVKTTMFFHKNLYFVYISFQSKLIPLC